MYYLVMYCGVECTVRGGTGRRRDPARGARGAMRGVPWGYVGNPELDWPRLWEQRDDPPRHGRPRSVEIHVVCCTIEIDLCAVRNQQKSVHERLASQSAAQSVSLAW